MTDSAAPDDGPDLAEEARRVASAVQDWVRRSGQQQAQRTGSDCDWCPICQFAAVLRAEHPELADRIGEAAVAITGAVRAVVDAAVGHSGHAHPAAAADGRAGAGRQRPRPRPRVERIDLDGQG